MKSKKRYKIVNPDACKILDKIFEENQGFSVTDEIYKAMETFAEQETVEFGEWLYQKGAGINPDKTTSELYKEYKQSKIKT